MPIDPTNVDTSLASVGATDNSLPSSHINAGRTGSYKRQTIHWFVPEFGIVKMYINPSSIKYSFEKIITPTQTKSGFVIQYFGEKLLTLNISGTTGSSGIEGINVLYEVYRAEQFAFDTSGLSIAADTNLSPDISVLSGITSTAQSLFGATDLNKMSYFSNSIPSLGSLAIGVEMYYSGWVFRGFFTRFDFDEKAEKPGIYDYNMTFMVTQKRGYRVNSMPWHRSAIAGPSNNQDYFDNNFKDKFGIEPSIGGIPLTFKKSDKPDR